MGLNLQPSSPIKRIQIFYFNNTKIKSVLLVILLVYLILGKLPLERGSLLLPPVLYFYMKHESLLIFISLRAHLTKKSIALLASQCLASCPHDWLQLFFPVFEQTLKYKNSYLNFVKSFTKNLKLFLELDHVLFADFIE